MPYTISFSDPSDPQKPNIIVNDNVIDERLSVAFVGKNASNYSSSISKNFLHLLENFASPTPPANPVQGQLWYNSIDDNVDGGLRVYDKTTWVPIGFVQKSPNDPNTLATPDVKIDNGDLFVDTANNQLYIKNGDKWRLVGPNTKENEETSAKLLPIIDNTNVNRSVLGIYSNNNILAIVSDREFTPKKSFDGFSTIKQGVNLSTAKFRSSSNINKFWGVSEKAESLIVGDSVVSSNAFLRSDVANITTEKFTISNNNGLVIGSSGSLIMKVELGTASVNNSVIYNLSSGSKIYFRLTTDSGNRNVLTLEPGITTPNGGVGINNTTPTEALDVIGKIKTNDSLLITGDTDATNLQTGSLQSAGGAAITKNLYVGQNLQVSNNLTVTGTATTGGLAINGSLTITPTTGIPALTTSGNIVASTISANRFNGNADTATYLSSGIRLSINPTDGAIENDIKNTESTNITLGAFSSFNGDLNLNLSTGFIEKRSSPNTSKFLLASDLILISRQTYDINNQPQTELFKLTGEQLVGRSSLPVGSITLWPNTASVPNGYVTCDGRELSRNDYSSLYAVLGGGYLDENNVLKFRVPNLSAPSGTVYIIFTGKFV